MTTTRLWTGILSVVICESIFGLSYLFTKEITANTSPLTLLAWRFVLAFVAWRLVFALLSLRAGRKAGGQAPYGASFRGKPLWLLFLLALFQPVIFFTAETYGISLTTASESGTIIASIPIVTLLFSALLLKEKPRLQQLAGIGVTCAGIVLLVLTKGMEASFSLPGYLSLLVAVISFSLYSVLAQKASAFNSAEKTYAMVVLGAVTFTLMALVENARAGTLAAFFLLPFTNGAFFLTLLFLGVVSSVLAFFLYNLSISCIGTNRAATFVGVSTLVSVLSGVLVLDEPFTRHQVYGTLLVLGGVYLANIRLPFRSRPSGTETE